MTVIEAWERLTDLLKEGHGKKRFGYFSHNTGDFIEIGYIEPTVNGGYYEPPNRPKKTEEVVHAVPGYYPGE